MKKTVGLHMAAPPGFQATHQRGTLKHACGNARGGLRVGPLR